MAETIPLRRAAGDAGRRRHLGELLLADRLITPDQLNRAMDIHKATGERWWYLSGGLPAAPDEAGGIAGCPVSALLR